MTPEMLRFYKNYATCKHPEPHVADFSFYDSLDSFKKTEHFWCANCCSRWYKGRHWTPDEWDEYVNDV